MLNTGFNSLIAVYSIGGIFAAISFLLKRKRYGFTLQRALIYTLVLIGAGMIELKLMGGIRSVCMSLVSGGEFIPDARVRIFGAIIFQPIWCYIVSLFSGDKFRKLTDSLAPETFMYFIFGKIECLLSGCCHGIPWDTGIYSHKLEQTVFPVQIYEALATLVVVIILYALTNCKALRMGSLFPIGTILYSIPRFVFENYRYYDQKVESEFFLGMTFWQMWCVISIIISVVWLVVLYSKSDYAEGALETNKNALIYIGSERIRGFISNKRRKNKNFVHHNKNKKKYQKKK